MKLLTRDTIFAVQDLKTERVDVEEWGGFLYVKSMSGTERDAFEESLYVGQGKDRRQNLDNLRARLVALTAVDEAGNRLFTDEDAAQLGGKSAAGLDRVFSVAQRLSGLSAADVNVLVGNSEPGPSASTTSG